MAERCYKALRAIVAAGEVHSEGSTFEEQRRGSIVVTVTVLITLWRGVESLRLDHEPDQAELDAIAEDWTARNCGVRPTVRVVESFAIPPYVIECEPLCEELFG